MQYLLVIMKKPEQLKSSW